MLDLIAEAFLPLVLWVVFYPVLLVISAPAVLVWAMFRPEPYSDAVWSIYGGVTAIWVKLLQAM